MLTLFSPLKTIVVSLQVTDGLAIGASFASFTGAAGVWDIMKTRGGLATLSILFHEIPHELGDFAVLVKSGFSKQEAIMAQFGTAFAAMIGTSIGLLANVVAGESIVLVTAGGFVYLATVNIIPDILNDKASLRFRFAQLVFFGFGVAFLYAVSLLEEMEDGHGHSHGHHHHSVEEDHHDHHEHSEECDHHDHHDHHDHGHGHDHFHSHRHQSIDITNHEL